MGALTNNRKRTDECFNLQTQFPFFNQHVPKKPRLSYTETSPKVIHAPAPVPAPVSRLNKYPEPHKLPREVHAPCRFPRFGFLSQKRNTMGNVFNSLFRKEKEKEVIDVEAERYKDGEISKELGEVDVLEDGYEGRSVVSDELRVLEGDGLELEIRKLDGTGVGSGDVKADSMLSDLIRIEDVNKLVGSVSLGRQAYKELLQSVDRTYVPKLSSLEFEIKSTEAQLQSIRLWKPKVEKKLEESGKDLLREPFVPLTEEEEREVAHALSKSNRRKKLVTHENSNIDITGEILQCLRPGAWLNDEVINLYLELLKERERREPKKFLNCHFFSTFFYKKLIGGRNGYDYKAVRRWTTQRKLGYALVDCDKIFVPIHREVHWCLAVINKRDKSLQYLDSLGGRDRQVLRVLARYFMDEVKDKSGQEVDVNSWDQEFVEDLPEQQNGFDCGVFMIKYADFYSRGLGLHFSQENMPYFRLRTAKEILRLRAD